MAVIENDVLMKFKDTDGNVNVLYPITKKDNVDGLETIEPNAGTTTSGTSTAYTATVGSITSLTSGVGFIMVPHTDSTTTSPTLNVNDLGAKYIRRRVSTASGTTYAGYSEDWLSAGKAIRVVYDGSFWIADIPKPNAVDLLGTVPVANGGTGATDAATARTNLGLGSVATMDTVPVANGGTGATDAATARTNLGITPANIGAATDNHTHSYLPLSGGTMTGGISLTPAAGKELSLSFYTTGGTYEHFTYFYGANSNSTTALGCYDNNGGGAVWSYNDQKKSLQLGGATVGLILTASSFGDTLPAAGTAGRIFFQKA